MTTDEIVRALRCEHGHLTNHGRDFMLNYTREEFFKILNESADLIESLQAQLAESQRREQAAVEDIVVAHDIGKCEVCKHKAVEDGASCSKWPDRSCFEWRGPQEAGKGERK